MKLNLLHEHCGKPGCPLSLYSNHELLRNAFNRMEGDGFFNESMSKDNPESLGYAVAHLDEVAKIAKEIGDAPSETNVTTVYGSGGGNRYHVRADGSILFSATHGDAEKAKNLGFAVI